MQANHRFFSLGQDVSYYSAIAALGAEVASTLLLALKDVVADSDLFARAAGQRVMGTSLMRSVSRRSIEEQFQRVLAGGAVLTPFSFAYEGPKPSEEQVPRLRLEFQVSPDSSPPTNIHVLIGRNGVGKSYLLNGMTRALVSMRKNQDADGIFSSQEALLGPTLFVSAEIPFASILSVTFSAFDDFSLISESRNALKGVRYSNVGLRKRVKDKNDELVTITRDPTELAEDFSSSAKLCLVGAKSDRWTRALTTLQADPIFAEAQVAALASIDESQFGRQHLSYFDGSVLDTRLSS